MQFLFVRSVVCLRLPSDSTSRWLPCPWLCAWCYPCARDSHPLERTHAERTKKVPSSRLKTALGITGTNDSLLLHLQIKLMAVVAHQTSLSVSAVAVRATHVAQVGLVRIRIKILGFLSQRIVALMTRQTSLILYLGLRSRRLYGMALLALQSKLCVPIRQSGRIRSKDRRSHQRERGQSRKHRCFHIFSPAFVTRPSWRARPSVARQCVRTP